MAEEKITKLKCQNILISLRRYGQILVIMPVIMAPKYLPEWGLQKKTLNIRNRYTP